MNNKNMITNVKGGFVKYANNPELIKKWGWVPLALPGLFYTADKVTDLIKYMGDNGYNSTIEFGKFRLSFTKAQIVEDVLTPETVTE